MNSNFPSISVKTARETISSSIQLRLMKAQVDEWEKKMSTLVNSEVKLAKNNPSGINGVASQTLAEEYTILMKTINSENKNQLFDLLDLSDDTFFKEITMEILEQHTNVKLSEVIFESISKEIEQDKINEMLRTYPRLVNLLGKLVPASSISSIEMENQTIYVHYFNKDVDCLKSNDKYTLKLKAFHSYLIEQWSLGVRG